MSRAWTLSDYAAASAGDLGRAVAGGEVSAAALVEFALAIAETAETEVNAYAQLLGDRARQTARERDSEAAVGVLRGPLHGVPIAVKDNMALAGAPTYKGSLTTSGAVESTSAPMVARLLEVGAIVIGKTTTPEFGWKGTGISPRTGVTRNARDPTRTSGGSSAGSAVTVATGAVPLATGSDAGGSVRIPAAFNGVVGLKPTLGAIPVVPGTVNENLSHAGVLSRTVADARLTLAVTRGADPRDPQSAFPTPGGPALPGPAGRALRVGVVRAPWGIPPEPEVATVFDEAIARLEAGRIGPLLETETPAALPRAVFEALWVTGRGLGFAELIRDQGARMDPGLTRLLGLAQRYSLADYFDALEARRHFNAEMFALFERVDLLLMPTLPLTAFAAEAEVPDGGEAEAALPWITWTPYTYPFNITGQPALSLPCGTASDGLPVGLQVVGPWSADDRVLDFAQRCEEILGPGPLAGPGAPALNHAT